jgi:hypothetical protein
MIMDKMKKYKKQIFTFITIWLLLQFGVYPSLTMANTFANIVGGIALLLLLIWGGLSLYDYVKSDEPTKEVINTKKKRNPKQFDGVKSNEPFVKTKTKPKTEKVMGEYQLNNKEKVRKSLIKNKK